MSEPMQALNPTPVIPGEDEPITLAEACRFVFRDLVTPATLRAEAKRGRLAIARIGHKDFVTARAVREMIAKCQPQPCPPASGSDPQPVSSPQHGSSKIEAVADAQAALNLTLQGLRKNSGSTSRKNEPGATTPAGAKTATPLKSPSPTC